MEKALADAEPFLGIIRTEGSEPLWLDMPCQIVPEKIESFISSLYCPDTPCRYYLVDRENPSKGIRISEQRTSIDYHKSPFLLKCEPLPHDPYDQIKDDASQIAKQLSWTFTEQSRSPLYRKMFTQAIMDRVVGTQSTVGDVIWKSFRQKPEPFANSQFFANCIQDVISTLFADKCLWGENVQPQTLPHWQSLIQFLSDLIVNRHIRLNLFKEIVAPFRPSVLSQQLIIDLFSALREEVDPNDLYIIANSMWSDTFFSLCFMSSNDLIDALLVHELAPLYPFVVVKVLIESVISGERTSEEAYLLMKQVGSRTIFSSPQIARAIPEPIFDYFYSSVFVHDLPYLEMTQADLDKFMEALNRLESLLFNIFSKSKYLQLQLIQAVTIIINQHNYEPKGISYVFFGFLLDRNIVSDQAFDHWFSNEAPNHHSIALELTPSIIPFVKDPFPNLFSKERKVPAQRKGEPNLRHTSAPQVGRQIPMRAFTKLQVK